MLLYYEGPNGNVVSDFVTPTWYAPGCPSPYDYLGQIPNAWQLASGGYVCYQEINLPGWTCPAADEARKVAAKACERLTRIENPTAGAIRQLRSKGMQVQSRPNREITVVKQKDVPKVGESRRAPKGGRRYRSLRPERPSRCKRSRNRTDKRISPAGALAGATCEGSRRSRAAVQVTFGTAWKSTGGQSESH